MNLLEDSFGNYVKLSELIMKNLKVNANGTKTSPFTFTPLTKLKMIDMEAAGYIGSAFNWPPNISVMNVNKNALRDFDVTNLYKLQRLSVNGNNLRDVPKIHQLAPLTELHAKQNQLDYLTAESLAYYCLLETLELDLHEDSKLNKAEKYCQCARVEKWLHNVNITVNVSLGCRRTAPRGMYCSFAYRIPDFIYNITYFFSQDANCSFEFSEAMAIRAKCLERHSRVDVDIDINEIRTFNDPNFDTVKALQNWSWQVAIPLFIVVALALIFMVCNKFKSSKRRIPSGKFSLKYVAKLNW